MPQGEFLSTAEIQSLLAKYPASFQDIALELRDTLITCCPDASERILWGGLSYHDSSKGGPVRGAICQIEFFSDHVRLSFIHGVRLKDPHSLMQGDRKSKRYLCISSYDDASWDAIRGLIEEAARLNPAEFGPLPAS